MNRLFFPAFSIFAASLFVGCATNENLTMGGVPEWLANGAQLSDEPAPRKPDAAIMHHETKAGPIEFTLITDKRRYPKPPEKKAEKKTLTDPLERGREARIKRLVR